MDTDPPAGSSGFEVQRRRVRWTHEPVVHFLVLGALLVTANQLLERLQPAQAIVVDAARVERLSELYRLQTGQSPGPAEREFLVADFVKEEALSREARALGLDRDDAIVRRRLVQKMEFLEPEPVDAPSEEELRSYYRENAGLFALPGVVSFSQLYFSPDSEGPEAAKRAAFAALAALRSGVSARTIRADRLPVPLSTQQRTMEDLARELGDSPVVGALASAPQGVWTGPVASGFGWHLVQVTGRGAEALPPFERNRARAASAWQDAAVARARSERLESLLERYPVVRR
jgi:peptidyl-prolyl cis-trans isomerase C